MLGVRSVTKPGSAKETIHIDYSLEGSGLTYVTGDALGVFPGNDPALASPSPAPGPCGLPASWV
ncbi:MAG: hypothetical protein IJ993_00600 [Akkermansia sp.]|nr:hypothetical protein [Akkermansia sp.]